MWWIALMPGPPEASEASEPRLAQWAQTWTPRVTWLRGAVLMEVAASERLFGGRQRLLDRLRRSGRRHGAVAVAAAPTAWAALTLLRQIPIDAPTSASRLPAQIAHPETWRDELLHWPIHSLEAAQPHLTLLTRLGCRTLGDLLSLPRDGLIRRTDAELLQVLDQLQGLQPMACVWLPGPDRFDQTVELPARVDSAPQLMFMAQRLIRSMDTWLRSRQRGVTEWAVHWQHERRRTLTQAWDHLVLRSTTPTQDVRHLVRVLTERLQHVRLLAPAVALRLELRQHDPLPAPSHSLLPDTVPTDAERWPQLLERFSARLGADQVLCGVRVADHRPTASQRWAPALQTSRVAEQRQPLAHDAWWQPMWLARRPTVWKASADATGWSLKRIDTGWWNLTDACHAPVQAVYHVVHSPSQGVVWIAHDPRQTVPSWTVMGWFG